MKSDIQIAGRSGASLPQGILIGVALVVLMGWLRVSVFPDRVFPLSSGLPLLLCLWVRDLRLLYGMAVALTILSILKVFVIMPDPDGAGRYEWVVILSQLANIWVVAGVLHGLIFALRRIESKNHELSRLNEELERGNEELLASNEELAASEEEITRQNEELRSQSEELEQQAEELRQQAEEMEQQSTEILDANQELVRKERGLQTLLDSSRWLRGEMNEVLVLNGVCQAAVQVLGEGVQASAVILSSGNELEVKGEFGFGLSGAVLPRNGMGHSFTELVIESALTASVNDIFERPDLTIPRSSVGPSFRAVLGSPIWLNGASVGTLEIYSNSPREWSDHEFRIIEWLAVQTAVGLQAIHSRQELEQKRSDAEDASSQKTRFLAAVSHDIRNPVNAISLLAEVIERSANDGEKVKRIPELAKNLWSNARSLVELVSDVLDLTRLESGIVDLDLSEFSLCELIREEVQKAVPHAEEKGLKLDCNLPSGEVRLISDRIKMARVIANLIGNAVKFTEVGTISLEYTKSEDGGLCVHVHDTGIGIPGEHLDRVFEEFMQGRNPERNREKGIGLGLAICRSLVKCLGFGIKVKSLVGVGSTFTIEVPALHLSSVKEELKGDANPGSDTEESVARERPLENISVLLVEDHEVAREVTTELLEGEGAVVDTAANGREAIALLSKGRHQVLLLDLNLPDFDGSEILRNLQQTRPPALRVVLAVSGDVRPERIEEVRRLGADGLVGKPLSMQKLKDALIGLMPA